jgi:ATP-dependent Clp protease ATP-binding subunit ClpB
MKSTELLERWQKYLVGQNQATDVIIPYINRYRANLHMPRRTVGNFFLTGPTGTGKTKTPETLARVLHGDEKHILTINCETFQMEHEIAKLIGSPPGYLGHKETVPLLSQARVAAASTEQCSLSIILFDEIDKASHSMWRLLLGILDKAELRLGDNTTTDFQNCLIFMTSNKGSKEIARELYRGVGFDSKPDFDTLTEEKKKRLSVIGKKSVEEGFSPEFFNRIDDTIVFNPLTRADLQVITELELNKISDHVTDRLKENAFAIHYGQDIVDLMARLGTDVRYGARFLKRTIDKMIFNPICNDYLDDIILPNSSVTLLADGDCVKWDVTAPCLAAVGAGSAMHAVQEKLAASYLYERAAQSKKPVEKL